MFGAWATLIGAQPAAATDITWRGTATEAVSPGLYNFSAGANWVNNFVPTVGDTAIFGATTTPAISVNTTTPGLSYVQVDGFKFLAGAPAYTFSVTDNNYLQFFGAGIVNGGSLTVTTTVSGTQFYNASSAGSATFINNSYGNISFNHTSTAGSAIIYNNIGGTVFSGTSTAGSATITNNSGGKVQFLGNSTGGNAQFVNNVNGIVDFSLTSGPFGPLGVPDLTAGSIAGAGNFYLGANALNVGGNNLDTTVSGVISDCGLGGNLCIAAGATGGSLVKAGTGTLTLTGANTYTGNTVVNGGTLTVNGLGSITNTPSGDTIVGGAAGSTGTMNVSGATSQITTQDLVVGKSGTGTFNLLNGATATVGSIYIGNDTGSVGTLTVDGATTVLNNSGGGVIVGGSGTGTFNVRNGGTANISYLNAGNGPGTVNIDGIGSSFISSFNGYTNYISSTGGMTVNVTNGGAFSAAGDVQMGLGSGKSGTINVSGGGSATTRRLDVGYGMGGQAAVTVSGSGSSLMVNGDLSLGSGAGAIGSLNVSGGGTATTNRLFADFTGSQATVTVSGAGSSLTTNDTMFVGFGSGTFDLLNGATATLYAVNLGGTMTIGPGAVANVTTQLNLNSSGILTYNISPAGTGRIDGFNAVLDGKLAFTGINAAAATYTLIHTTGGITGTLRADLTKTNPDINFGTLRNPNLRIVGNDLLLSVDANSLAAILQPGVAGTAKQIADAVDAALLAGVTLPAGFNGVFNLTGDALVAALKQLSGQSAAGAQQTSFDASNSFVGAMFDPFAAGRAPAGGGAPGFAAEDNDDAMAYAPKRNFSARERDAFNAVRPSRSNLSDPRWSIWGSAYGGATTTNGSAAAGTNDTTSRAFGVVTGADYNLTRNTTAGFALGGGGSNYGVAGNLGSGRAEIFQAGLFARHTMGAAYVAGGLGYTFQNVTADRTVTVAGTDQLRATFNANTFSARGEGGTRFATPIVGVTPYAALQATNIALPGYGEVAIAGNNTFALNYNAKDTTIVRTEVGARFDRAYALQTAMLTLRSRLAWAHDQGNSRNVSAAFGSLPGSNFTISGAVPSKDLALVSAGADFAWTNNVTLAGTFEGEFGGNTTGYGGKGTVRYAW